MTNKKRNAILDTTLELVAERGFHNTPMSMIAKNSGASMGIIYHYFGNKEELIIELYKKIKFEVIKAMLVGYSEDKSFEDRFHQVWLNTANYYSSHPKETVFLEQFENSPYLTSELQLTFVKETEPLGKMIEKSLQEGVIKDLPIVLLHDLHIGVAVSLAKRHIAGLVVLSDQLLTETANACWDAVKR